MSLLEDASLLLTPNAEKEGKLYSIIPTNGNGDFSVTRATTATRVNAAGLVELVPYNIVQFSEQFDNAAWSKSASSITANSTTAPNGTLTADTWQGDGTATPHRIAPVQAISVISGTAYTVSCYVQKNTNNFFQFYFLAGQFGSNAFANFDVNNGVVGTVGAQATATITDVGNGWYRCSMTSTAISTAASGVNFTLITSATATRNETNSLATSVFLWGAKFVEGASALDYQMTETRLNIPRLDYSLGSCPNILLEPQRTNLALRSEEFDNAAWTKSTTSVTANSTTSPSGILNADSLTGLGGAASTRTLQSGSISATSGTAYTATFYAKKDTNNFIQIFTTSTFGGMFANFDLNNGVVGTVGTITGSNPTSSITNVGNGWYRCTMTLTSVSTGSGSFGVYLVSSASAVRNEQNTLSTSVFLWGAQLEAGAYATSYIPTTSASVTRNLDVVQKTGVSSLIGQTEGTLYWEGTLTSGLDDLFYLNRSTTNSVFIYKNSTNLIVFRVNYGGSFISINNATAYTGTIKIAAAYKSGDSVLYINGVQAATSATAFTFTGALTDVVLNNTAYLFGNQTKNVKTAALFPNRLTNAQLAALTA